MYKVHYKKELFIAPFVKRLKAFTLERSYCEILPALGTIYLFSSEFLLIEGLLQGDLQKELVIGPFVECLKTATLGKSY